MEDTMLNLRDIFKILKRRKRVVIGITMLCVIVGIITSFTYKKEEEPNPKDLFMSTASILVVKTPNSENTNTQDEDILNKRLLQMYRSIGTSRKVIENTIEELHLDKTPKEFTQEVRLIANQDAQALIVYCAKEDEDGNQQVVLNTYMSNFIKEAKNIIPAGKMTILDEATKPEFISKNDFSKLTGVKFDNVTNGTISKIIDTKLILATFVFLGIMLSVGVVLVLEHMDKTLKKKEDAENIFKANTLSTIPYDLSEENENVKESFRTLRTNLEIDKNKVFCITSSDKGEGKTLVSVNLAKVFAEAGYKTLIIDGNGRNPDVSGIFNLGNARGISEALCSMTSRNVEINQQHSILTANINPFIIEVEFENLYALSWGNEKLNPADVLSKGNVKCLIEELKNNYEYIIIDTAAMVNYSETQIISKVCDKTVIVTAERKTNRYNALRMKKIIDDSEINVKGLVWREDKF